MLNPFVNMEWNETYNNNSIPVVIYEINLIRKIRNTTSAIVASIIMAKAGEHTIIDLEKNLIKAAINPINKIVPGDWAKYRPGKIIMIAIAVKITPDKGNRKPFKKGLK